MKKYEEPKVEIRDCEVNENTNIVDDNVPKSKCSILKNKKILTIICVIVVILFGVIGCTVYNATLDKTPPVFSTNNPTEIEFVKDCKKDIISMFKATDETSDVTITVDDTNVDYSTVGEYVAVIVAMDESGNIVTNEVTIKILEPTVELNVTELNLEVGDEYVLEATTNGNNKTINWDSSDESIATVDDNGKIVAVKNGSVTIKASANGVEATCSVVVKEVVTETTTTKKETTTGTSSTNKKSTSSSNTTSSSSNSSSKGSSGSGSSSSAKTNSSSSSNSTTSSNHCTNNNNHSMSCGNIGKWFDSRSEIDSYWKQTDMVYFDKLESGLITYEEYGIISPNGYECWSCSYCGKWTGNFKYRYK